MCVFFVRSLIRSIVIRVFCVFGICCYCWSADRFFVFLPSSSDSSKTIKCFFRFVFFSYCSCFQHETETKLKTKTSKKAENVKAWNILVCLSTFPALVSLSFSSAHSLLIDFLCVLCVRSNCAIYNYRVWNMKLTNWICKYNWTANVKFLAGIPSKFAFNKTKK